MAATDGTDVEVVAETAVSVEGGLGLGLGLGLAQAAMPSNAANNRVDENTLMAGK